MLLKGVGAGISPSRMKNNTCQRAEELLASQRPTCISVVANSWKGSPQTAVTYLRSPMSMGRERRKHSFISGTATKNFW